MKGFAGCFARLCVFAATVLVLAGCATSSVPFATEGLSSREKVTVFLSAQELPILLGQPSGGGVIVGGALTSMAGTLLSSVITSTVRSRQKKATESTMVALTESVDQNDVGNRFEAMISAALKPAFEPANLEIQRQNKNREYSSELTPEIVLQYGLPPKLDRLLLTMRYQERGQITDIESNNEVFLKNTRFYTIVMGTPEPLEGREANSEYWTANDAEAFREALDEGIKLLESLFSRDAANEIPGWEGSSISYVNMVEAKTIESDGERNLLSCFTTGVSACYISAPERLVLTRDEAFPNPQGSTGSE